MYTGVTLGALPLSLPSPTLDKQVKWTYKLAEIISFSLILSAQMESRTVSNLSPESAGVGLVVYKDSKSNRLINLLSCNVCCVSQQDRVFQQFMLKKDRDPQTFILTFHCFKILPSPAPDATFADISSLMFAVKSFLEMQSNRAKSQGSSSVKV